MVETAASTITATAYQTFETYIAAHSEADFTHCMCPGCTREQLVERAAG